MFFLCNWWLYLLGPQPPSRLPRSSNPKPLQRVSLYSWHADIFYWNFPEIKHGFLTFDLNIIRLALNSMIFAFLSYIWLIFLVFACGRFLNDICQMWDSPSCFPVCGFPLPFLIVMHAWCWEKNGQGLRTDSIKIWNAVDKLLLLSTWVVGAIPIWHDS